MMRNLPWAATEEDLANFASEAGEVVAVKVRQIALRQWPSIRLAVH
jgi:hypothetical protein